MTLRGTDKVSSPPQPPYPTMNSFPQPGSGPGGTALPYPVSSVRKPQIRPKPKELYTSSYGSLSSQQTIEVTTQGSQVQSVQTPITERLAVENSKLKEELQALRHKRDAGYDAMDKMLSDLMAAHEELEELKDQTPQPEENDEVADLRLKVDRLLIELEERDEQVMRLEHEAKMQKPDETKSAVVEKLQQEINNLSAKLSTNEERHEKEVRELQQEVQILTQKQDERDAQLIEEEIRKRLESGFEVKLQEQCKRMQGEIIQHQNARTEAESQLRVLALQQTTSKQQLEEVKHLAETQRAEAEDRALKAEEKSSLLEAKFQAEKRKVDDCLEKLQRARVIQEEQQAQNTNNKLEDEFKTLQASHATELERLRKLFDFFKNNSERLSRQMKDLQMSNHVLQQSAQSKESEVAEQSSLIYALRIQLQELQGYN